MGTKVAIIIEAMDEIEVTELLDDIGIMYDVEVY